MSFKIVALLAICAFAQGARIHPRILLETRIVNGRPIDITEAPYQVAVGNSGSIWCGGSIISERFVLTAAHCFNNQAPIGIVAFVGMNSMQAIDSSMMKSVRRVYINENYNKRTHANDIAILELAQPLQFSSKAQAVRLPRATERVPVGALAFASGWGLLRENGDRPETLQGVNLPLLDARDCGNYGTFDQSMLCAGVLDGSKDTCQGDSGGPLVYNGVQYGIVSFGRGCATPGFPGVYAHVINLRSYITRVTGL